ncbi:hypothetical protein GCM10010294_25400 [Streptomyces griseoloalbus]|nr:hypothetical protein GCM10010294_25400 [Streptomyces griseoloalbus]
MSPQTYDAESEPDDVMDVADEVAYADTGRPWAYRRLLQQDGGTS